MLVIRKHHDVGYTWPVMAGERNRAIPADPAYHQEYTPHMAERSDSVQLRPEDIAHLLTLLKNSTSPLTTQQLVDAFKQRAGQRSNR